MNFEEILNDRLGLIPNLCLNLLFSLCWFGGAHVCTCLQQAEVMCLPGGSWRGMTVGRSSSFPFVRVSQEDGAGLGGG